MNFQDAILKGIEIVKLNKKVIGQVAKDKSVFTWGLLIIAIGGLLSGLVSPLNPILNIAGMISGAIFAVIFTFIGVGIIFVIAKIFGGKGSYMELFRVISLAAILGWLNIINMVPILGIGLSIIIGLWQLVMLVVILMVVMKLGIGKSIVIVLIPLILVIILMMVLAATVAVIFGPQIMESLGQIPNLF